MLSLSITSPSVPLRPRRIVAIRLEDLNLAAPSIGMLPALPPVPPPPSAVRLSAMGCSRHSFPVNVFLCDQLMMTSQQRPSV